MASTPIRWKVPASVTSSSTAHTIQIYSSTSGENGVYSVIDTISAGSDNSVGTYTHANGDTSYFYYVTYTISGGSEGDRVLAVLQPGITEQRLAEQISGKLPEIIAARIDSNLIDIRKALKNALDVVNAYSPVTAYTYTNLPGRFEGPMVVLAMMFLYLEHQLQVGIRDYSYGGTGITLSVDRNSKFASTLTNLNTAINQMLEFVKKADWPDPIGLGTVAVSTPQARVLGFLFNTPS